MIKNGRVQTCNKRYLLWQNKDNASSLNDYLHECGRHPHLGAKIKKDYQAIAANAIRTQLPHLKIEKPIVIRYRFYEADKQRDKGNIFSFADKVFEDALQQCKVIPNDGWSQIADLQMEFFVDAQNPRIEIVLEEVDANGKD